MSWLEHRIPPPLVFLIVMAAMIGGCRAFGRIAPSYFDIAALVALCAAGLALGLTGAMTFRHAGANLDPHHIDRGEILVTGGVFRFTRNPMYLGLTLILCGVAFYLAQPLALLGSLAFALYISRFQIQPEERAMRAKFGERYAAYCTGVRRWL